MTTAKHHIFTRAFWNRGRIIWGVLVAFCTSVPLVGGSLVVVSRWTEANVVSPYITCKIDSVCEKRQEPLKQDIRTMIGDVKYMRKCAEYTTPKEVRDAVESQMKYDSISEAKYVTR